MSKSRPEIPLMKSLRDHVHMYDEETVPSKGLNTHG